MCRLVTLINSFLSVNFAFGLITWLSLIPNFVAYRKPRWWRSNPLIRQKNMGTRVWFLSSIHCVSLKISVYTISHVREVVSFPGVVISNHIFIIVFAVFVSETKKRLHNKKIAILSVANNIQRDIPIKYISWIMAISTIRHSDSRKHLHNFWNELLIKHGDTFTMVHTGSSS